MAVLMRKYTLKKDKQIKPTCTIYSGLRSPQ